MMSLAQLAVVQEMVGVSWTVATIERVGNSTGTAMRCGDFRDGRTFETTRRATRLVD